MNNAFSLKAGRFRINSLPPKITMYHVRIVRELSFSVDMGVTRGWKSKSWGWYPITAVKALSKMGHKCMPKGRSIVGMGIIASRSDVLEDILAQLEVSSNLKAQISAAYAIEIYPLAYPRWFGELGIN